MKFTTEELLLAAAARPLASDLRKSALATAKKAADLEYKEFDGPVFAYTEEERNAQEAAETAKAKHIAKMRAFEQDWLVAHPLIEFVKPAMAELESVARVIRG